MLERLKLLREERSVSQKQLADVVSVSQQSINKYENHNIEPDIETLTKIADFFDTSIDYLVGHTDVRRRIEDVKPCDLNKKETGLVESFRKLTPKQKKAFYWLLKAIVTDIGISHKEHKTLATASICRCLLSYRRL